MTILFVLPQLINLQCLKGLDQVMDKQQQDSTSDVVYLCLTVVYLPCKIKPQKGQKTWNSSSYMRTACQHCHANTACQHCHAVCIYE